MMMGRMIIEATNLFNLIIFSCYYRMRLFLAMQVRVMAACMESQADKLECTASAQSGRREVTVCFFSGVYATHTPHHASPTTHAPSVRHAPLPHMPPCHACVPPPCMPPVTHAPCHTCPLSCIPPCHACPPTMHPPLPCMPPLTCHTCPPCHTCPLPCTPPCEQND